MRSGSASRSTHFSGVLSGIPEYRDGRRLEDQGQEEAHERVVSQERLDERILIFAPVGKDAPLTLECCSAPI